jgi:hypothetical protein
VAADTFGWHERGIGCDANYGYAIGAATKIQAAVRNRKLKRILNTYKKIYRYSLSATKLQDLETHTGLPLVQLRGMSLLQG